MAAMQMGQQSHAPDTTRNTKAWVIESDTLKVTKLELWNPPPMATTADPELTAIGAGSGDISHTVTYDNSAGRFTFHDLPESGVKGPLNYLVCGWYSNPSLDPLSMEEGSRQNDWSDRLAELSWSVDMERIKTAITHYESTLPVLMDASATDKVVFDINKAATRYGGGPHYG
jgi:hypothetical protein